MPPKGPLLPSPSSTASRASPTPLSREQSFSVRPAPGTPTSHKTFLRIHLHRSVLANLGLMPGELCHLAIPRGGASDHPQDQQQRELFPALAWPSTDSQISGKVVQVSEGWRGCVGLGLEVKVVVGKYQGELLDAGEVIVREVDGGVTEGDMASAGWTKEGEGWRFVLENALCG